MPIDKNLGLGCTCHRTDDQKHLPRIPNQGQREREREITDDQADDQATGRPISRGGGGMPVTGLAAEMDGSWILGGCSILGTRQPSRIPT